MSVVRYAVDRVKHPTASFGAGWLLGWYFGSLMCSEPAHPLMLIAGLYLAWVATEEW